MQFRQKILHFKALSYLCNSLLPLLFWVLLLFGFDCKYIAVLTLLSAALHELGHLTVYKAVSGEFARPRGHLSGFRINIAEGGRSLSYAKQAAVSLGGPGINVALAALFSPFSSRLNGYVGQFCAVNALTALSSLLPVEGYDGYGAARLLLLGRGLDGLARGLEYISFIITSLITVFSLYLMNFAVNGPWLFGVFFALMLEKISKIVRFNNF